MKRFSSRLPMTEVGKLIREMDVQSSKIKLALIKFEVRVERLNLRKEEVEPIVKTLRKIYIYVYEKLQTAVKGSISIDFEKRKKEWIQAWSEGRAIIVKLNEIIEDMENSSPQNVVDKLLLYQENIHEILLNPPKIYHGSYEDEVPPYKDPRAGETPGILFLEPEIKDKQRNLSIFDFTLVPREHSRNKQTRKIWSGNYTLQSDIFHSEPFTTNYSAPYYK